ncbi:hypothetical protein O9929_18520 [Vibrio lentus]|nr:hypothetical protein [Vibrio lentus]
MAQIALRLNCLVEIKMDKLHFAGRLDVDTTGLVLMTDDGKWSHQCYVAKLTKFTKKCTVWLVEPVEVDYGEKDKEGIQLQAEWLTLSP